MLNLRNPTPSFRAVPRILTRILLPGLVLSISSCTRVVSPDGVLGNYEVFDAVNKPNFKLRFFEEPDNSLDKYFLTRAEVRRFEKKGIPFPDPAADGVDIRKAQPVLFVIPEPVWTAGYQFSDPKDQEAVTFTIRERLYRYLLREYPDPARVRYALVPDDPTNDLYRVIKVQSYVTFIDDGQGFWRYALGYGAGAAQIQIEGQFLSGADGSSVLGEFAIRDSHGGYPKGFTNPSVIDPCYCLKYAVDDSLILLTENLRDHIPAVCPRPLSQGTSVASGDTRENY